MPSTHSSLLVSSSPPRAKQISFPLSPSTGPSLVGSSHLLFLPFLFHLRRLLSIFQMRILSWAQNSPVYANQPLRLGAAEMCRTSDTPWDSSLWCWGLSCTIWKVILQLLPEAAPLGQGFRQAKNSLNRKLFLLFMFLPALNLPQNTVRTFLWWENLSLPFWAWL